MNIQGLHNLCVVYVERGKLIQALECLQRAHKLAPEEDYILRHLKIVQQRIANSRQQQQTSVTSSTNVVDSSMPQSKSNSNDFTGTDDDNRHQNHATNGDNDFDEQTHIHHTTTNKATHQHIVNANVNDKSTASPKQNSIKDNAWSQSSPIDSDQTMSMSSETMSSSSLHQTKNDATNFIPSDFSRDNAEDVTNNNGQQQKQRRYRIDDDTSSQQSSDDTALPSFVHDLDDPSSGTS